MTQSATLAQNRHILAMLGISLWASRGATTKTLAKLGDRLCQPPVRPPYQPSSAPTTTPPVSADLTNRVKPVQRAELLSPKPEPTPQPCPPLGSQPVNTAPPVFAHEQQQIAIYSPQQSTDEVYFHLEGIRYGDWVLMVDKFALVDFEDFWQRIKQGLRQQAHTKHLTYQEKTISYPPECDGIKYSTLKNAQATMMGFIFGFRQGNALPSRVAFLTKLPCNIAYQGIQSLPSIREIATDETQKKSFWQSLQNH